MPTVLVLALFSFVFTLMASFISNGTVNVAVLNKERVDETHEFFENIAKVALNDITNSYYEANPKKATTPVDYINGMSELKRLSTGRVANPTLDAWGQPIQGKIFTEYQSFSVSTDTYNNVMLPVTGFAFVSSGPDRIMQTQIPQTINKLSDIYSIVAPSTVVNGQVVSSDDIVYTFDNRKAQQELLDSVKLRLNRIGTAALKEIQSDLATYRRSKLNEYQTLISQGKDVSITSIVDITNDPNAPHFAILDRSTAGLANRKAIGVDEDFAILEAPLAGGGHFIVSSSAPQTPADPLQIILLNADETTNKTPWGNPAQTKKFRYQVTVQAVSSTLGI